MKYKLLLSDADGTLFDFDAGKHRALVTVLDRFGLPSGDDAVCVFTRINESIWKRFERGLISQDRLSVERFEDFLKEMGKRGDPEGLSLAFIAELGNQRLLIPGADRFCRRISEKMPIYLVTNGIAKVQRSRVAGSGVEPYLAGIVISEEIGCAKPNPEMLYAAMKMSGLADLGGAVMLGDSITADIQAARNAGIDSVLFLNGKAAPRGHGATFVANTYKEAEDYILRE